MKKKHILPTVATIFIFGFAALATLFALYYSFAMKSQVLKSGELFVSSSTENIEQLASQLVGEGFVKDSSEYVTFAKKSRRAKIYPGHYVLSEGMSYKDIMTKLGRGAQMAVKVVFNNIRDVEKLASVVSKSIEADSASIADYILSDENAKKYGFKKETFLAMFIPNSYQFYWNCSAEKFAEKMYSEYNKFWNKSRLEKLKKLNLTQEEVLILASIVNEESKANAELATIAGVYLNRLNRGMLLQADPTVKFAVGDPTLKRILFKHLEVNSPYNTYKNIGLPPGVISQPPIAAIDAVLENKKHSYFYFCASPNLDGTHRFARTLSEHNRNAAAYQAALNRLKIR